VRWAKRRNPAAAHAVFDFIGQVLRLEHPATLSREEAESRRHFALKMQQVTGPAMAKGLEDTAFYRYYPLASLNEVGGDLDARALDHEEFHLLMGRRNAEWPHTMSASGTHDAKRGEDFRARLHVLSEVADEWIAAVKQWNKMTRPLWAEADGDAAPDRNELYLLYQTLVGTWPAEPLNDSERAAYVERIQHYMQKALREAKLHTSWVSPSAIYESTVAEFVRRLLTDADAAAVRDDLAAFAARIAHAGYVNGLTQVVLKALLPGVPDFYQGTEYWDFNLVDPDNRRPVDYASRRQSLDEMQRRFAESPRQLAAELSARLTDDRTKQFVTWRALAARSQWPAVVTRGDYTALQVDGQQASHAYAFARSHGGEWIAAIVPRQIQCFVDGGATWDWGDATVELPPTSRAWRNELNGAEVDAAGRLQDLLEPWPVAILTSQSL
jgi:(1->4)-alpha-D-glucan 1-alpha-D-glucosylmutase